MGCLPSKQSREETYEERRINAILLKPEDSITIRDIEYLKSCLDEFEKRNEVDKPLLLMTNINDFLQGIEGQKAMPVVSDYDLIVARIKSNIREFNKKIKQLEGEKQNNIQLAKENKSTNLTASIAYLKRAKLNESSIEQTLKLIERLEDYLSSLHEAELSSELVHIMDQVATSLERLQKSIGSAEEVAELTERMDEFNKVLCEMIQDDEPLDSNPLNDELERMIAQEEMEELNRIQVPQTKFDVEVESKEESRELLLA